MSRVILNKEYSITPMTATTAEKYKCCTLCARRCGIDRTKAFGYCGASAEMLIARAALHMWEEPPISGTNGSGTVFFCGCSLGCIFCQNKTISRINSGKAVTPEELAAIMLRLEKAGAHNINFVTPTHYIPSITSTVVEARKKGLKIPIVYNTGSYELTSALKMLDGHIDIYLPDFKYYSSETAKKYSSAPDYREVADAAIEEMVRQVGEPLLDEYGIMRKGVIVRVLLLPSHVAEAKLIVSHLYKKYGNSIYISLMNQYTPMPGANGVLSRRVSNSEYSELVDFAIKKGIERCFIQEGETAKESFIPPFDPLSNINIYT